MVYHKSDNSKLHQTLILISLSQKIKKDATLQLNEIGSIHIVRLPSRTQPIMALGDSIKVNAVIDYNSNLTDYKEFFKQSIVKETLKSMTITNND